jgi:hypothetical protein
MRPALILVLCYALLSTHGQEKSTQGVGHGNIISQSNWGVFFTKERTIHNGESYFRHTIIYDMLPFKTALPPIDKIQPCDLEDATSKPRKFKCKEINELVDSVNVLIREEVNVIIKDVTDALQLIPDGIKNIDLVNNVVEPKEAGGGGGKRKTRNAPEFNSRNIASDEDPSPPEGSNHFQDQTTEDGNESSQSFFKTLWNYVYDSLFETNTNRAASTYQHDLVENGVFSRRGVILCPTYSAGLANKTLTP